jgi:hypothetical protein
MSTLPEITALRVEVLEHEAVLLEDTRALPDFGDRRIPVAPLADRELQRVVRMRRDGERERQRGDHAGDQLLQFHPFPPSVLP